MTRGALVVLLVLGACEADKRDKRPMDRAAAAKLFEQVPLPDAPHGMSDLTIDDRGVVWGISERDRKVIAIDVSKRPVAVTVHELSGIAPGVDTEAIAWLGNGKFAIGIEGTHGPWAGIVMAELQGSALVATATRQLSDGQLGVTITGNHGIEAVCGRDGELLAVAESIGKVNGRRWAPLVRLRGDSVELTRVWLTTNVGKISAITCTLNDDGLAQVTAIERHFGVARILTFAIARGDKEATPTVELDLHPVLRDKYNLEGITKLPDGRLVMINDNQSRTVTGPTELFVFYPR